ncbi:hypothetical protein [Spiroplasma phoeniceum]|nr:hypothetical protein [Spiroplasma phoeniceum]
MMKRLLTIFSAFVLGSGSAFGVTICKTRPKHIIYDEEVNTNKDLEIWNQIKDEAKQTFKAWWDTNATVDINDYPDQIPFFTDLVTAVEKTENSLSLTREEKLRTIFL